MTSDQYDITSLHCPLCDLEMERQESLSRSAYPITAKIMNPTLCVECNENIFDGIDQPHSDEKQSRGKRILQFIKRISLKRAR